MKVLLPSKCIWEFSLSAYSYLTQKWKYHLYLFLYGVYKVEDDFQSLRAMQNENILLCFLLV